MKGKIRRLTSSGVVMDRISPRMVLAEANRKETRIIHQGRSFCLSKNLVCLEMVVYDSRIIIYGYCYRGGVKTCNLEMFNTITKKRETQYVLKADESL